MSQRNTPLAPSHSIATITEHAPLSGNRRTVNTADLGPQLHVSSALLPPRKSIRARKATTPFDATPPSKSLSTAGVGDDDVGLSGGEMSGDGALFGDGGESGGESGGELEDDRRRAFVDEEDGDDAAAGEGVRETSLDICGLREFEESQAERQKAASHDLCEFCDRPMPPHPSFALRGNRLALLKHAELKQRKSSTNPQAQFLPLEVHGKFCRRHQNERLVLPQGRERGYPDEVNWHTFQQTIQSEEADLHLKSISRGVLESPFVDGLLEQLKTQSAHQLKNLIGQQKVFNEMYPGYYGTQGYTRIYHHIRDREHSFPRPALLRERIDCELWRERVLIPELGAFAIQIASNVSRRTALILKAESVRYGIARYPDEDEEEQLLEYEDDLKRGESDLTKGVSGSGRKGSQVEVSTHRKRPSSSLKPAEISNAPRKLVTSPTVPISRRKQPPPSRKKRRIATEEVEDSDDEESEQSSSDDGSKSSYTESESDEDDDEDLSAVEDLSEEEGYTSGSRRKYDKGNDDNDCTEGSSSKATALNKALDKLEVQCVLRIHNNPGPPLPRAPGAGRPAKPKPPKPTILGPFYLRRKSKLKELKRQIRNLVAESPDTPHISLLDFKTLKHHTGRRAPLPVRTRDDLRSIQRNWTAYCHKMKTALVEIVFSLDAPKRNLVAEPGLASPSSWQASGNPELPPPQNLGYSNENRLKEYGPFLRALDDAYPVGACPAQGCDKKQCYKDPQGIHFDLTSGCQKMLWAGAMRQGDASVSEPPASPHFAAKYGRKVVSPIPDPFRQEEAFRWGYVPPLGNPYLPQFAPGQASTPQSQYQAPPPQYPPSAHAAYAALSPNPYYNPYFVQHPYATPPNAASLGHPSVAPPPLPPLAASTSTGSFNFVPRRRREPTRPPHISLAEFCQRCGFDSSVLNFLEVLRVELGSTESVAKLNELREGQIKELRLTAEEFEDVLGGLEDYNEQYVARVQEIDSGGKSG